MTGYPVLCVLTGGPLYQIYVDGVWILFEDHHYCGPMPLDKRTFDERLLGPRHRFWKVVTDWYQAGKKTGREKKIGRELVKYCAT
jgi:hypothetical protein